MSNSKEQRSQSIEELLRARETPLFPDEFAQLFPYVLRSINQPPQDGVFRLTPQSGEMTRYGVFFWALQEPVVTSTFASDQYKILIPSAELFMVVQEEDSSLLEKGIVVFPSKLHTQITENLSFDKYARPIDQLGFSDAMGVDIGLNRKHIVLDLNTKDRYPILSVPASITLNHNLP